MTQPVEPIWLGTEHWLFEPTASGLLRQRQVTKHRAEDRAAPITVDKIQQRIRTEQQLKPKIEITDAERFAAVKAIQQLQSYTFEKLIDTAIQAINDERQRTEQQ